MENLKDLLNEYISLIHRLCGEESVFYFYDGLGKMMDDRTPPRKMPEQFESENKIIALRTEMSKIKKSIAKQMDIENEAKFVKLIDFSQWLQANYRISKNKFSPRLKKLLSPAEVKEKSLKQFIKKRQKNKKGKSF